MMKTKLKPIVYLTLSVLFLISCNKDDFSEVNPLKSTYKGGLMTYDDYLAEMARPLGPGSVLIQNNAGVLVQKPHDPDKGITISTNHDTSVYAFTFYDKNGKTIEIIDQTDLEKNEKLYDNELKYSINGLQKSMYIPKLLYAETSTFHQLKAGTKITWNADEKNDKGVVIWLTYKPTTQMRWDIMEQNRNYITEGWVTEDNGSYTITSRDLERFPSGAQIDLNILRTNFIYNGLKAPSLIAYTLLFDKLILDE